MGNFFTKIVLQGVTQDPLVTYISLLGRKAFISPTVNNFTVVYDEKSEGQNQEIFTFTSQLSSHFNCPAIAILVHDDLVLHYELYQTGEMIDDYVSNIGFQRLFVKTK